MPRHRPHLEGEVDEGVFQPHGLLAAIDDVFLHRLGQAAAFLDEGVEQLVMPSQCRLSSRTTR
jgi:hypothetical protein